MIRPTALALVLLAGCQAEAPAPAEGPSAAPTAEAVDDPAQAAPADQGTVAAMEGEWRSQDDPLSTMTIEDDRLVSVYDGQADPPRTIRAVASCDDLTDAPASRTFVIEEEEDPLCYELDAVTEDHLSYFYAARGNRLAFERVGG